MKILHNGIAVIEGDTHVSKWVEEHGTLKIAAKYLEPFRKYVPYGGVVVDVGAMIGDHTLTYAEWVGPDGRVYAYEPNPDAFECLGFNTKYLTEVICLSIGLSDAVETVSLSLSPNAGASFLHEGHGGIRVVRFDDESMERLDFIKIDAEGFETKILRGAKNTIAEFRPVMLIEVNDGALVRAGSSANELLRLIESYGYTHTITDDKLLYGDPQYDVICVPFERDD